MLFRAILWIGIVALLLPRVPELHSEAGATRVIASVASEVPAGSSDFLFNFQTAIFDRLAGIRADIEAQQRARARTQ